MITITFNDIDTQAAEGLIAAYKTSKTSGGSGLPESYGGPVCGPAPIPVSAPPAPITAPVVTAPAVSTPATAPAPAPAPAAPVAAAPAYTLQQLSVAAAPLIDAGRLVDLQNLIRQFGVDNLTALPPQYYGDYATAIRAMGAKI